MAKHCGNRRDELPWLIQFESNGLCNESCGPGKDHESAVVSELEGMGYRLMAKSKTDTDLVLEEGAPLYEWTQTWSCRNCGSCNSPSYVSQSFEPYESRESCRRDP